MKAAELRELSVAELEAKAGEIDEQLFRLRMQKSMGQLESAAKLRPMRKDLARIRTLLKEKGE
ncbi:MAG: 50S ribosomal protein L29 [Acidobacteriota bacterium]|nr:50S ribosomal protein L29 [Acidobacteriota bacterium]